MSPIDCNMVKLVAEELFENGYFTFEKSRPRRFRLSEKATNKYTALILYLIAALKRILQLNRLW